jgi:hypothetical protein
VGAWERSELITLEEIKYTLTIKICDYTDVISKVEAIS